MLSYEEYLERTGQDDSRTAWKLWKIEVCGMSEKEAIRASIREYVPLPKLQYPLYGVIQNWKGMKETNYLYTCEELQRFDPKLYKECNQDYLGQEGWHDSEKSPSAYVTWQGTRLNNQIEVRSFLTGQFNKYSCLSNNHWYWMNSDTNDLYGEVSSTLRDACFEVFGGKQNE